MKSDNCPVSPVMKHLSKATEVNRDRLHSLCVHMWVHTHTQCDEKDQAHLYRFIFKISCPEIFECPKFVKAAGW